MTNLVDFPSKNLTADEQCIMWLVRASTLARVMMDRGLAGARLKQALLAEEPDLKRTGDLEFVISIAGKLRSGIGGDVVRLGA